MQLRHLILSQIIQSLQDIDTLVQTIQYLFGTKAVCCLLNQCRICAISSGHYEFAQKLYDFNQPAIHWHSRFQPTPQ